MSSALPPITPLRAALAKEVHTKPQESLPSEMDSTGVPSSHVVTSTAGSSQSSIPSATHHRFVLTDHVALRFLEEDPSINVLVRRQKLEGYEIYFVEQWACSRAHPTFVITTYTGDPKDTVWGSILSVPADESAWSPHLRVYFKSLDQCHARRTETSYGTLMVTNLGAFPSSLTVIPVPDGDARKNRELFFVNVNLKRLGCAGRLGITLAQPNSATQAKFQQLYRTSDKVPVTAAVIELVKMCQIALVIFGTLEAAYADGLLCDVTELAINDWWVEFGSEYYAVEPHDGILGPTTVAALLGMLIGARNRLNAHNEPIGKDVFDVESTKRGIASFQKSRRLRRTGILDRQTLERLRRATAKAASKEGWNMPRALKSTVAELGGKGGEMVMGMVGAGDKAGIADVETVDIDRFVELVQGERAKWLWLGKPRKTGTVNMFNRLPGEATSSAEDNTGSTNMLRKELTNEDHRLTKRDTNPEENRKLLEAAGSEGFDKEKDPYSKRAAIKRATEKIESGTGFHRIKDAVGRRSHQSKLSKDETQNGQAPLSQIKSDIERVLTEPTSLLGIRHTDSAKSELSRAGTDTPGDATSTFVATQDDSSPPSRTPTEEAVEEDELELYKARTVDSSIAESVHRDIDNVENTFKLPMSAADVTPIPLRRTQSSCALQDFHASQRHPDWWPRHLSFSIAEESVLTWTPPTNMSPVSSTSRDLVAKLASLDFLSLSTKNLYDKLSTLAATDAKWTREAIADVDQLDAQASADTQELDTLYLARLDEYHSMRDEAHEIVSRDRLQLQDAIRELETLGAKLDYEIKSLRSRVDDVEDGVVEFERQVGDVEDRVRRLEDERGRKEGWMRWGVRMLTGIGKAPG
jgi:hypothetical protein